MSNAHQNRRTMLLTWEYGSVGGGLGRAMQWIADECRAAGMNLIVVSPFPGADVRIFRFLRFHGAHLVFSLLLPFALRSIVKREHITRILVPVCPGGVFLLRWPKGVSVHAIVDHLYVQQCRSVPGEWWKRVFIPFERHMLMRAAQVTCVSPDTRDAVMHFYGVPSDVFVPFVFSDAPSVPKEPGSCLCVSRLTARKGIPVLLRAWEKVHAAFPSARLCLIGDGRDKRLLDRLSPAVRASIDHRLHLPYAEVLALYDRSDIILCPSHLEGFSLFCGGGMSRGAAPIASDADGLTFFIEHGRNGLLVPTGDAEALAFTILSLLHDPMRTRMLGEQARASIRMRFSPERAREALLKTIIER
ncbi:hypothetical protein A3D88_02865 [Candidatus Peribacteria bacterium RIFCSPHIGHO2_02_FULL_52_16]|nr:MAG: hypothetical protein A2706_00695 [Candidatus Peribacteria bacterium RIFCSPHIGHO2_01_FULL_51_35]OGJ61699.1 MAG: hypothetical protein A3D88_02865 [Candidatus Peribacteria bacterium RIFCSPHIGHO2_02_FULL_52_16]